MAGIHTGDSVGLTSLCYSRTYTISTQVSSLHVTAINATDTSLKWTQLITTTSSNFNSFKISSMIDPAGLTSGTKVAIVAGQLASRKFALMILDSSTGAVLVYKEYDSMRYENSVEMCSYDLEPVAT